MSESKMLLLRDKEIERTITDVANKTAKQVVEEFKVSRLLKNGLSYYKRTEIVLSTYEDLKIALKEKEEDIKDIRENGLRNKSKSITMYSSSTSRNTEEDRYTELLEKYDIERRETEREIRRIERALSYIKDDKYYEIIKLKYLTLGVRYSDEKLSEVLEKDRSTITRNKNRLITKVMRILFPESIKEII